jgi:hypothetical protein
VRLAGAILSLQNLLSVLQLIASLRREIQIAACEKVFSTAHSSILFEEIKNISRAPVGRDIQKKV